MKCTLPSEVYMLLKSSDFVLHDVSKETVFESCLPDDAISSLKYDLELVLRKWYSMDPSREFRCFVRGGRLLGKRHSKVSPVPILNYLTHQVFLSVIQTFTTT